MNKNCDNCKEFKKIKIKVFNNTAKGFGGKIHNYYCSHKCYVEAHGK